jgi:hypothetical protein
MNSSRSVFGAVLGIRRKEEEAGLGAYELVGLRVALGELRRCLGLDKSFDDEPGGGDGVAHGRGAKMRRNSANGACQSRT